MAAVAAGLAAVRGARPVTVKMATPVAAAVRVETVVQAATAVRVAVARVGRVEMATPVAAMETAVVVRAVEMGGTADMPEAMVVMAAVTAAGVAATEGAVDTVADLIASAAHRSPLYDWPALPIVNGLQHRSTQVRRAVTISGPVCGTPIVSAVRNLLRLTPFWVDNRYSYHCGSAP